MGMRFAKPHPASQGEIKQIINSFTHAAEYLHKAGFDGIQVLEPCPWKSPAD